MKIFVLIDFSRNATDLSAGDILFLALLAEAIQTPNTEPQDKSDLDVIIIEKANLPKLKNGSIYLRNIQNI